MRTILSVSAFFSENIATLFIGAMLLLALFFAGRSVYKKRRQGGCAGCSGCNGNTVCTGSADINACCCTECGNSEVTE